MTVDPPFGPEEILKLLPHRPPMVLVDRVLEISTDRIVAEKRISEKEPWIEGHFPGRPVMPGVLILEAIAQTAGLWVLHTYPEHRGRAIALAGIDRARFRRPVVPGDLLCLTAFEGRERGPMWRFEGSATVSGERVADVRILAAFVDEEGDR
ncbi:MAG: 3-hydroxyacyl-ACP dehydratase FabZ [Myxococcota bacterium]